MKRLKIPIIIFLTAVILAGCFLLPTFISRFRDRQTIGMLAVTDGSGISYEKKFELKTIDRLKMMTNAARIEVDIGKNMDANTAYDSAMSELGELSEKGILEIDRQSCELSQYGVALLVDSSDPSKSMIVWDLYIKSDSYYIFVSVDDETGILLTLNYNIDDIAYKKGEVAIITPVTPARPAAVDGAEPSADENTIQEQIGQTLADYYELEYMSSEIENVKYYTRVAYELSDGQTNITLYVTFTYLGFMVST